MKRFNMFTSWFGPRSTSEMLPDQDGDYVLHYDAAAEIASLLDRLAKAEAELEKTKFERRLAVASIAEELDLAVAECRAGRRARDLAAECLNDSAGCSVCGDSNALYEAAIAANPLPEAPRA